MKHILLLIVFSATVFVNASFAQDSAVSNLKNVDGRIPADAVAGDEEKRAAQRWKLLWVESYAPEYPPIGARHDGAQKIFDPMGIEVRFVYMNTEEHPSEDFGKEAGLKAKAEIEKWKPDLVIASDDAASKYLVMPYYKNVSLPIVFIGVNWDASPYNYPYSNATGQLEVEPIKALIDELGTFAAGTRIALLTGDTLTDRRTLEHYKGRLGIRFDQEVYVETFDAWKEQFHRLQAQSDILILRNKGGIDGWNDAEARAFVLERTRIPTGAVLPQMAPFVMIGYTKVHEELGEYAARTALKILNGTPAGAIPIESNERAEIWLNLLIAEKLDIVFKPSFLDKARIVRGPNLSNPEKTVR